VEADKSREERRTAQAGEAPSSFAGYNETVQALLNAGYKRGRMDFHPAHWGYEDYFTSESPTLHVSVRGRQELVEKPEMVTTFYRLDNATFHVDLHTQMGSWSELGKHVVEVAKKAVGVKP
jgi:hypothetical protein